MPQVRPHPRTGSSELVLQMELSSGLLLVESYDSGIARNRSIHSKGNHRETRMLGEVDKAHAAQMLHQPIEAIRKASSIYRSVGADEVEFR